MRQTARLIAIVATKEGRRPPVAWLLDVFFLELLRGLEANEVPRRVAADMFGVSRRTLMRRIAAAEENAAVRRRTEWIRIYEAASHGRCTREELAASLKVLNPETFRSVVRDMVKSGWLVDDGGFLETLATDDHMTDEAVAELIDLALAANAKPTVEHVAHEYGLNVERVRALWPEEVQNYTDAVGEAARHGLTSIAHHTLKFLGHAWQGTGQSGDVRIYWLSLVDKPAEALGVLRDSFSDANASIRATLDTIRGDDEPPWIEGEGWLTILLQQYPRE